MNILYIPSCGISPVDQLSPGDTLLRCQEALRLWRRGGYDLLGVGGGMFLPPGVQKTPAAVLMREWFIARGVEDYQIIDERRSLDTYQNAAFLLEELAVYEVPEPRIMVVTQWQHAIRFWITFRRAHGVRVRLHPIRYPISWKTWMMEWFLIFYHAIDRRGTLALARKNRAARAMAAAGG